LTYVLDTNLVIAGMNGDERVLERLRSAALDEVIIPLVVIAELLYGAEVRLRTFRTSRCATATAPTSLPFRPYVDVALLTCASAPGSPSPPGAERSMVENTLYRYKTIIGPTMRSRTLQGQRVEARVSCRILNTMAGATRQGWSERRSCAVTSKFSSSSSG
jgi:hypothetical protein